MALGKASKGLVIFTTLAMNQTRFFAAMDEALSADGFTIVHICFHEQSHRYLQSIGRTSFSAFDKDLVDRRKVDLSRYGGQHINLLISHEKAAFEINKDERLIEKYRRYLAAIEAIWDKLPAQNPRRTWLIQELGGFLSLVAAYHVARARHVDNIFIEPSFFRRRVFFVRNSFAALRVTGPTATEVQKPVDEYLDAALAQQRLVIPVKDTHHYRKPFQKVLDPYNIRRLIEKLRDKYVLGMEEEFGHIGGHVRRHLGMAVNNQRLKRHYAQLPEQPFVYYPFHVPADVALTLRSPEYLDQYALIDYIARSTPGGYRVVIKEHPALIGALDYRRLRDLRRKYSHLVLAGPTTNNYEVMRKAATIVTVNSKSGAEALLIGKPVIVLGDTFYFGCGLVHAVERLGTLPHVIASAVAQRDRADEQDVRRYFQDVWDHSFAGELYDTTAENVRTMADSLQRFLAASELYGSREMSS